MTPRVVFESVSKEYSLASSRTLKDILLDRRRASAGRQVFRALDRVSFEISDGEAVALAGHNGSGKSTALKLLAGIQSPTSGVIRSRGRVVPLLELGSGFHPDLTGRENIYMNGALLGMKKASIQTRMSHIIDFSGIGRFIDQPVKHYSSGMAVRLGFSVAVHVEPEVLLLDEVLGIGDAEFQERSLATIQKFRDTGTTMIIVSHSSQLIEKFCSRQITLSHGSVVQDSGDEQVGR